MAAEEGEVMGSLSNLPEDIIYHILSFLTTQEAAQTSILSKAWLNTWRRRPTLDFDFRIMVYGALDRVNRLWDAEERERKISEACQYIISTLHDRYYKQKNGLQRFSLMLTFGKHFDFHFLLDRCIELAVKNGVGNLNLSLDSCALPQTVFEDKSLVDLNLENCCLQHQNIIMCCRLKRLCLDKVSLDEVMFGNIISNCPLIEILIIRDCQKIRNFNMTNLLRNLKQLKASLDFSQCIEVEAPNLELIDCRPDWDARNRATSFINLRASRYIYLRSLLLSCVGIDENSFVNFEHKFPHVEYLSIGHCPNLQRIKISSSSIKEIQLARNNGLKKAEFDVPRLALFEYHGDGDKKGITPKLSFTATSGGGPRGWSSHIKVRRSNSLDTSWFSKLKEFLMGLNQSEIYLVLKISVNVAFDVGEMTNSNSDTFSRAQEIRVAFVDANWVDLPLSSAPAILDGIFWACRPCTISIWGWWGYHFTFTEQLYEILNLGSNPGHHHFQQLKFWQRDLEAVNDIEIFTGILSYEWNRRCSSEKGLRLQLPLASGRMKVWEVLELHDRDGNDGIVISFNLEWKTCQHRLTN